MMLRIAIAFAVSQEQHILMSDNTKSTWALGVETSCRVGSIAIARDGRIVDRQTFTADRRHAVELIPASRDLVARQGITPQDVTSLYVSGGPGSFTGMRVGFTFVRALAQVTNASVFAVPTSRVIVENLLPRLAEVAQPIDVAVILDAKRGQVYAAAYRYDGTRFSPTLDPCLIHPADLLKRFSGPLTLTGEGIDYHRDVLVGDNISIADKELWLPNAENVLRLGLAGQHLGSTDRNALTPIYIRLPEAEEKYQAGTFRRK